MMKNTIVSCTINIWNQNFIVFNNLSPTTSEQDLFDEVGKINNKAGLNSVPNSISLDKLPVSKY